MLGPLLLLFFFINVAERVICVTNVCNCERSEEESGMALKYNFLTATKETALQSHFVEVKNRAKRVEDKARHLRSALFKK